MSDALFPLFLKLGRRDVLVIGAGPIASRKIEELVDAGARVRVVAPAAVDRVRELAASNVIAWDARPFEESDADDAWLVFAATGDPEVQARARDAAEARRTFLVALDDPTNASAHSAAVVRRAPFTVAISSSGASPALARLLREVVEHILPGDEWVAAARALRAKWRAEKTPMDARFGELVRAFAARA